MRTLTPKKSLAAVFCCGLAAVAWAVLIDLSTSTVIADAAIVIKNDGICGMPGADANGDITYGGLGIVTTRVENGNKVSQTCKGRNLTNLSGRGQHFAGFLCQINTPTGPVVVTTDTHATVAASGNGSMTCIFTKP